MLRLSPTSIASLCRPRPCERRGLLRHRGGTEAEPSAYDKVLRRLGQRHAQNHIASYDELVEIAKNPTPRASCIHTRCHHQASFCHLPACVANA